METMRLQKRSSMAAMLDPKILNPAIRASFVKLHPRAMIKNPVMSLPVTNSPRDRRRRRQSRPPLAPSLSTRGPI